MKKKEWLWKNKFMILLGLDIFFIGFHILCLQLFGVASLWLYCVGILATMGLVLAPLAWIETLVGIHKNPW